jgi:phosphatidylserine/phosphatidylglycerophosphate/cardiolipin synthase-like enzyme
MSMQGAVKDILSVLSKSQSLDIEGIKKKMGSTEPILPVMLWLHSMNFVTKKEVTTRHPVLKSQWAITQAGRSYLEFIGLYPLMEQAAIPTINFLAVVPPEVKKSNPGLQYTDLSEALSDILASAQATLLISSPYLDETLTTLLRQVPKSVHIRILTEDSRQAMLVRLKTQENVEMRTFKIMRGGVQLSQVHAKIVCVDNRIAIISSANINERSMYYNFEAGTLVSDARMCQQVAEVFGRVFEYSSSD